MNVTTRARGRGRADTRPEISATTLGSVMYGSEEDIFVDISTLGSGLCTAGKTKSPTEMTARYEAWHATNGDSIDLKMQLLFAEHARWAQGVVIMMDVCRLGAQCIGKATVRRKVK